MIEIPKLVLILLIGALVWYAVRWINRPPAKRGPRRPAAPRQQAIEDLVACNKCGTYVAAGSGCGRPGCPQLR